MSTPLANTVASVSGVATVAGVAVSDVATVAHAISEALASDPSSFSGNSNGSTPSAFYALIGLSVAATILVVIVLVLAVMFVRKNQSYVLLGDKP